MLLRTTNTTLQSAYLPSDIAGGYPEDCICVAEQIANRFRPQKSPDPHVAARGGAFGATVQFSVAGAIIRRVAFPALHVQFAPPTVQRSVVLRTDASV
jgi:hypothetical protein